MKVDGGISARPARAPRRPPRTQEEQGYDGVWTAETTHDPFFPLLLAAEHTERVELGTGIAVAFARNPMTLAQIALRPAGVLGGPLHPRPRQPDQAAHHEAVLDAVVAPGGPHAGDDPGHPGHLGVVERRHQARLPGRLLHAHADDAVLQPRPQPARRRQDLPGRRRRADDRGGRRGVRRLPLPRLHHRALPPRGHPARPRAGRRQGRPHARRTSRSPARPSSSPAPTRRRWQRRSPARSSRSRSTARRRRTAACSSSTAGATSRTSSTRCRSRASGRRWATLIDDEILNTFAVVAEPEKLAAGLDERYGDVVHRISFYAPVRQRPRRSRGAARSMDGELQRRC